MHKCLSSLVALRKAIGVAQIASHRLASHQPHPRGCLVDLLYVLLEVRSGYKSLITFWKPILDILSPLQALAGICALKPALTTPGGAGRCSSSAHLDYGDGRGEEGRCDHARQYLFYPQQDAFCQATNQTNNPKPNAGSQLPAVKFTGCSFICGRSVAQKPGHRKQRHVLARWQRWWTCLNLLMLLFMKC